MNRRLVGVVVALLLAACGSGSSRTSSESGATGGDAWVAGHLPDGFSIISAEDRDGFRSVGYAPADEHEYQVLVSASSPAVARPLNGRDLRLVRVRGHDATLVTLTDEGHAYGFAVAWDERPDLHLVVEGSNGPSEADTLAVAADVHSISDAEWQKLLVELSRDTYIGHPDANATAVDAVRGNVGADDYVLTALVPGGYPLGDADRRLDCFSLTFRTVTTKVFCPGHPIWERVAGQIFVFGDASADVTSVRVSGIVGTNLVPFTVDTFAVGQGPPTRFYVAPLPNDACVVSVDNASGPGGPGPTGPLVEAGDDYTRCTRATPGLTPPSTAPN